MLLMRRIPRFAEKVFDNLVDTAAQGTANAIAATIRGLLRPPSGSNHEEPESGITVKNADQQFSRMPCAP